MKSTCDHIAAAVAGDQPLTDAQRGHAERCPTCADLVALPERLAATTNRAEPRVGFAARATAGALDRLGRRRRRRVGFYAAAATAAAAATIALIWLDRAGGTTPSSDPDPAPAVSTDTTAGEPADDDPRADTPPLTPDELRELIDLSDTDRSLSFAADWDDIEAPLAPLRAAAQRGDHR